MEWKQTRIRSLCAALLGAAAAGSVAIGAPATPYIITSDGKALKTNVVVPEGQASAPVTISWNAGTGYKDAQIWVLVDAQPPGLFGGSSGAREALILPGRTHTFKLYSDRTKQTGLATLEVRGERPAPSGPPSGRRGSPISILKPRDQVIAVDPLIKDVQVVPSARNVVVSFKAPPYTVPTLEISKDAPERLFPDGRWSFARSSKHTAYPVGGDRERGEYQIDIGFITELDPATTYHYVLNARANDSDPKATRQQVHGTFTTLSQTVKVIFTRILVLNDSDPNGNGELIFHYFANGGGTDGAHHLNAGRLDWGEGSHDVHLELVVPDAPDQFPIQVDGYDDDGTLTDAAFPSTVPISAPRDSGYMESNLARDSFDLTQRPGPTATFDFRLNSAENGGEMGDLSFAVFGRVEITRSLERSPVPKLPAYRPPFVLKPKRPRDAIDRSRGPVVAKPKNPQDAVAPAKPVILKPRLNRDVIAK